jgi:hypothetical protein
MISRRCLGALAFIVACRIVPARAEEQPVVPLVSFFAHWDHHWYVWLKGDATYEAVEVMSRQRGAEPPQVWVFFTERAAPKRQIHFTMTGSSPRQPAGNSAIWRSRRRVGRASSNPWR